MLRPGPAAVVVVVADGYEVLSRNRRGTSLWRARQIQRLVVPRWFPIAAGLTMPLPQLDQHVPVLGGHIAGSRLPTCRFRRSLSASARRAGTPAGRWAKARPGVRVDEHLEPDLPAGYLYLERLSDEAAAWCAPDGRFGLVEWTGPRITFGRPTSTGRCRCCGPAAT